MKNRAAGTAITQRCRRARGEYNIRFPYARPTAVFRLKILLLPALPLC
ncbi:MAG: hypothetical protein KF770_12590 [Anaerolineae bacterium]|nr:hypothetical protein [Anaerolineae bacterium]